MRQVVRYNLFFLFLLYCGRFFSQEINTIHLEKKRNERDYYPQIEGYFLGEIPILKLGSLDGLTTKVGWKIISFEMDYAAGRDYKNQRIFSNVIPDSIIIEITQSAMNEQIFFTKIMAKDELNVLHLLNSMTLIPIKKEDE
ncbi:MAG: hypothetical protein V4622_01805 [Bacteroidota bacterium]